MRFSPFFKSLSVIFFLAFSLSGCGKLEGLIQENFPNQYQSIREIKDYFKNEVFSSDSGPKINWNDENTLKQLNDYFVHELYEQVLMQTPEKNQTYQGWLERLDGGFSREGIYHAFVLGQVYRKYTTIEAYVATKQLRKFAAIELAHLQKFNSGKTDGPEGLEKRLPKNFFQLKRVFADQYLKSFAELTPTKKMRFFTHFAKRFADQGIDLGAPVRNKVSESFHRDWAKGATEDVLLAELLMRSHRLLNAYAPKVARR